MAEQVRRWAEQDLTGGFYLGIGGGNTKGLSDEYLQGSGRSPSDAGIGFLSEEYFALYAKTIEAGLKNGNPPMDFYDEWGYPSGLAGGPQRTGQIRAVEETHSKNDKGQELTAVPLKLAPVSAAFFVTKIR